LSWVCISQREKYCPAIESHGCYVGSALSESN
jgi:hypothetical protein